MIKTLWLVFGVSLVLSICSQVRAQETFPAPGKASADKTANFGAGIQRTMRLLATSTPQHRNRVRILFYGQSITEQAWSKMVADDLRRRFPNADLEIANRAIGGFASQLLIRPAEHDLYPFYPDLVIFHVYGADKEYEEIIRNIRTRTTAEVLMQTDHVTKWPAEKPDPNVDKGLWWDDRMNNEVLPRIAKQYGCGLATVRSEWLTYLRANHLEPSALLKDGVHLNDHGCYVMAQLVERHLVYRPELTPELTVHEEKPQWNDGKLTLTFEGNRIDAIANPGGSGSVTVLIDGKAPSTFGLYYFTRPQPNPWSPLALVRVDHDTPLLKEEWTLTVTEGASGDTPWKYRVEGSVTGPDGMGQSDKPFVSSSGRVKIAPEAFFRGTGKEAITVGYTIRWSALPLFTDTYTPPNIPDPTREYPVTLVQGLPNGPHTLTLVATDAKNPPTIKTLRIYCPPVK